MTYEVYRYIFLGGVILSVVMLSISIILFFALNIPNVIGDLTGANARKAIEDIRNQNENSGEKLYKSSEVNRSRGKLTDKISPSGTLMHHMTGKLYGAMRTEKISTQKLNQDSAGNETTVLNDENGTTVLSRGNETTVLNGRSETTVLSRGNETTVLNGINETMVLNTEMFAAEIGHTGRLDMPSENYISPLPQYVEEDSCFEITYEITWIHTEEVIV
uniref:hypothetical protein n=1 Tax=Agathobacter sp. TaxID=2021311 RepID=UPI004057B1C1